VTVKLLEAAVERPDVLEMSTLSPLAAATTTALESQQQHSQSLPPPPLLLSSASVPCGLVDGTSMNEECAAVDAVGSMPPL